MNFGKGEPEEPPFTCGACCLQDAQLRAARPSELKATTGYTIEELAGQDITDRHWSLAMSVLVVCRHRLFDERTLSLTTSGDWDRDPESGAAEDFDMADGYEGPGEGRSSPERERHLLRGQHRGVWSRWVLAAILQ